jgi:hypothetical protein
MSNKRGEAKQSKDTSVSARIDQRIERGVRVDSARVCARKHQLPDLKPEEALESFRRKLLVTHVEILSASPL